MLIGIRRDALDHNKLHLPNKIADDGFGRGHMVIPWVEALHTGPIAASTFLSFIFAEPCNCWLKVEPSDDLFALLSDVNEKWRIDPIARGIFQFREPDRR